MKEASIILTTQDLSRQERTNEGTCETFEHETETGFKLELEELKMCVGAEWRWSGDGVRDV